MMAMHSLPPPNYPHEFPALPPNSQIPPGAMINIFTGSLEFQHIQHPTPYYFDPNHNPNQNQISYDNQNRYYTQIHPQIQHPLPFQPHQQGQLNITSQPIQIPPNPYTHLPNPYPNQDMIFINTHLNPSQEPQSQPGFISNSDIPVTQSHFRSGSITDIYNNGLDTRQYNIDISQDNQYLSNSSELSDTDKETDTQMLSIVEEIERDEDSLESQLSEGLKN
jgi:hypothetical protein